MLGFGAIGESPISALPDRYTIPASETEEGKERLRAYYEALGRFVDMFARVETSITLTLWHYAKTRPEIAKIIFAGTKIEVGSTNIKQLAEATRTKKEARDDLTDVFQQVGIINSVRNHVLHYGATSVAEGNPIVSNALKAKGEPVWFPISPTRLDEMTTDLLKVTVHLNHRHLGDQTLIGVEKVLQSPWLYKHPVQMTEQSKKVEGQQFRKRDPKRSHQP